MPYTSQPLIKIITTTITITIGRNIFKIVRATDLREGMARIMDEERRFANRKNQFERKSLELCD